MSRFPMMFLKCNLATASIAMAQNSAQPLTGRTTLCLGPFKVFLPRQSVIRSQHVTFPAGITLVSYSR